MSIASFITSIFALTPAEEEQHHQLMVDYGIEPSTPAEQSAMDAEDAQNYIEHIKSHPMRTGWIDPSDGYYHWQEYVIDQHNRIHVLSEGSHYCGYVEGQHVTVAPVIDGEPIDDDYFTTCQCKPPKRNWFFTDWCTRCHKTIKRKGLPVYMQLQG